MRLHRSLLTPAVVIALGACGARVDDPPAGETACRAYAEAAVNYDVRCGANNLPATRLATLVERMTLACSPALSLPGTSITPALMTECARALNNVACGAREDLVACEFPPGALELGSVCVTRDQCRSGRCVREGKPCGTCQPRAPLGATCESSSDCVAGTTCTGTCVVRVIHSLGESCDARNGEFCQPEAFCDPTNKCSPRVGVGAACGATSPCLPDLACSPVSALCVVPIYVGEGQHCGGPEYCERGLACDVLTRTCGKITLLRPGSACETWHRCEEGTCDPGTKKCPAAIPDGEACIEGDRTRVCRAQASCFEGRCQFRAQLVCR